MTLMVKKRMERTESKAIKHFLAGLLFASACFSAIPALAQGSLLSGGWEMDQSTSSLSFQSVKNGSKVESSSFANFTGSVDQDGKVTMLVELNSVDTKIDLRNVRMRFLFFETFQYPVATVTTQVDEQTMKRLEAERRIHLPITFQLNLHGVTQTMTADTVMTLFAEDQLSIVSSTPVSVPADRFNLMEGILKLQEAANVQIVPSGSVTFDLTFKRNRAGGQSTAAITTASAINPRASAAAALETQGDFSFEECEGRFDILSQTRAITFEFGSSELNADSYLFLETLLDIIQRCPSMRIVIAGHTDSSGSDATNMMLSSARAESVTRHLLQNGVDPQRLRAVGFGESRPLVPNDTQRNRARNRRIEFTIDGR
jgi:OmpA-OmpF porin, OOP family